MMSAQCSMRDGFSRGRRNLRSRCNAGDLVPGHEPSPENFPVVGSSQQVAPRTAVVMDRTKWVEEALGMCRRLEPSLSAFPLACGLMAVFRPVISSFMTAMLRAGQHLLDRWRMARQLVGDDHSRLCRLPLNQATEKGFCRLLVTSLLEQDVQHHTIRIYRPPHTNPL
jgi:hypothetical protein